MSDTETLAQDDFEGGGFIKKEKGKWRRFELFDGTLCIKFDGPGDPSQKLEGPIETQNPRTKALKNTWVDRYDALVVKIVNIERFSMKFEKGGKVVNYNLMVQAPGKDGKPGPRATLQMHFMDALLRKFLKVAPNIDFNKWVRIAAFKGRDGKQVISIKQGDGPVFSDWPAVPFYWQHKIDEHTGKPDYDSKAKAPDGTIMPPGVYDDDDESWDFSAQNKFLVKHFRENTMPVIEAIAKSHGIEGFKPPPTEAELTHTGPVEPEIPIVTERPSNPEAFGLDDAMTASQATKLRKLCKRIKGTPEAVTEKVFKDDTIEFNNLSIAGAAYLTHRIEKLIAKTPEKYPDPDASVIKEHLEKQKAAKNKSAVDDEWDASGSSDDDDDEDDFGTKKKAPGKVKSAFHDDDEDEEDDDEDIDF